MPCLSKWKAKAIPLQEDTLYYLSGDKITSLTDKALKTKCDRISTVFQILPLSLLFIQNLVKLLIQYYSIGKIEN